MNYEKAYKEALERAKSFQEKYGGDYAGYIFPELRESEDERMVRKIESFLSAYGSDYFSNDEWREIEVWFEKQKEQKPVEIHIDNPNIQKFDPDVKITTSDSSASGDELLYVSNKSYNIGYRDGKRDADKPHWKPSDGQMEAVRRVKAAIGPGPLYDQLGSLLNDLKRL